MTPASLILLPVGPMELGFILLIVLVLFGASRLGDLGKGLGDGIKNFKDSMQDDDGKADSADAESAPAADEKPST
jgi:sec-independent protein translocase protein TatA